MIEIKAFLCQACGAPLDGASVTNYVVCPYCKTTNVYSGIDKWDNARWGGRHSRTDTEIEIVTTTTSCESEYGGYPYSEKYQVGTSWGMK